jgi:hypothetical protein
VFSRSEIPLPPQAATDSSFNPRHAGVPPPLQRGTSKGHPIASTSISKHRSVWSYGRQANPCAFLVRPTAVLEPIPFARSTIRPSGYSVPLEHFVADRATRRLGGHPWGGITSESNRVGRTRSPHVPVACPGRPEAGEDRPRADVIVKVRSPDSYATIFTATLPRHAGPALSLDVLSEEQYCS